MHAVTVEEVLPADVGASAARTSGGGGVARAVPWSLGALGLGAVLVAGQPLLVWIGVLCLCVVVAAAIAPGGPRSGLGLVALLPASLGVVCLAVLTMWLAAGVAGIPVLRGRAGAAVALAVLVGGCGVVARRRRDRIVLVGADAPALGAAVLLMGLLCWVTTTQPFATWSRVHASGTDFLRHLGYMRRLAATGMLEPFHSSYPAALHSLVATVVNASGIPTDAMSLWRALAPVSFALLALMLVGVTSIAARVARACGASGRAGTAAAVVGALAFVQTAWFSAFLDFGAVMNLLAGVCLLAVAAVGASEGFARSGWGRLCLAAALATTANAWQLVLPVIGAMCLPWIVSSVRHDPRRPSAWLIWGLGLAVSLSGLAALGGRAALTWVTSTTVSGLWRPDWWWGAAIAAMLGSLVSLWVRGHHGWAVSGVGALLGMLVTTAWLMRSSGSSWELMGYYPAKALWTSLVVVIPFAAAGAVLLTSTVWASGARWPRAPRVLGRAVVALVCGVVVIGVAGRVSSAEPHLIALGRGTAPIPNWAMAVVDELPDRADPAAATRDGVVVFGLVPSADVNQVRSGFVGMVDSLGLEALDLLGVDSALHTPLSLALRAHDTDAVCEYLRQYPSALRVTGPNPAAGPGWLVATGCPVEVVQPASWVSLPFAGPWLARSVWADRGSWRFPSPAELDARTDGTGSAAAETAATGTTRG